MIAAQGIGSTIFPSVHGLGLTSVYLALFYMQLPLWHSINEKFIIIYNQLQKLLVRQIYRPSITISHIL